MPTANKCPFSHQTLFDPADCQLTVDFLSNITRFLRTFRTALFGTATGSLLYSAAVSKFFNRIRRTSAAHQYLQKVRIGENEEDIGLNGTCNKPAVFDARIYIPRSFVVMKANGVAAGHLLSVIAGIGPLHGIHFNIIFSPPPLASPMTGVTS